VGERLRSAIAGAALLLAASGAYAADPQPAVDPTPAPSAEAAPPAPVEPTAEQRQKMAAIHRQMADCLGSDQPFAECREQMRAGCKAQMGEQGCPGMGMGFGGRHGRMGGPMMPPAPPAPTP